MLCFLQSLTSFTDKQALNERLQINEKIWKHLTNLQTTKKYKRKI